MRTAGSLLGTFNVTPSTQISYEGDCATGETSTNSSLRSSFLSRPQMLDSHNSRSRQNSFKLSPVNTDQSSRTPPLGALTYIQGFGFASPVQARLATRPNLVHFEHLLGTLCYGPTTHLQLLSTCPRGHAVTFSFTGQVLLRSGLPPLRVVRLMGAHGRS